MAAGVIHRAALGCGRWFLQRPAFVKSQRLMRSLQPLGQPVTVLYALRCGNSVDVSVVGVCQKGFMPWNGTFVFGLRSRLLRCWLLRLAMWLDPGNTRPWPVSVFHWRQSGAPN